MPTLDGSLWPPSTALGLVLAIVLLVGAASTLWVLSRRHLQQDRDATDALSAVMGATVLRRDREETLARILETSVEKLQAVSGTLHLEDNENVLQLSAAEGVERFDFLTQIPMSDGLIGALANAPEEVIVRPVEPHTPWAALSPRGEPETLVAFRLGGRTSDRGLMVLAWRSRSTAEQNLGAVRAIGRHTRQVLSEFDTISQRAREMQQVLTSTQRQDVWVRMTAHDLGNELQSAAGTVMRLQATGASNLISRLERQLSLAQQMLSELTDPDRPIEPEVVPVEDLVEVVGGLMAMRRTAGVHFRMDVPTSLPDLWCERLAVMRVFDNLLQNAVRHNPDHPNLHILVRAQLFDAEVQFEVSDTGQGIAPEVQADLFQFGHRIDGAGMTQGYGLGLWSCRRIVEAHGGRIGVESQPGQGACFWFTLPIVGKGDAAPKLRPRAD